MRGRRGGSTRSSSTSVPAPTGNATRTSASRGRPRSQDPTTQRREVPSRTPTAPRDPASGRTDARRALLSSRHEEPRRFSVKEPAPPTRRVYGHALWTDTGVRFLPSHPPPRMTLTHARTRVVSDTRGRGTGVEGASFSESHPPRPFPPRGTTALSTECHLPLRGVPREHVPTCFRAKPQAPSGPRDWP